MFHLLHHLAQLPEAPHRQCYHYNSIPNYYSCLITRPFIVTLLTLVGEESIYTFTGLYAGKENVATV